MSKAVGEQEDAGGMSATAGRVLLGNAAGVDWVGGFESSVAKVVIPSSNWAIF